MALDAREPFGTLPHDLRSNEPCAQAQALNAGDDTAYSLGRSSLNGYSSVRHVCTGRVTVTSISPDVVNIVGVHDPCNTKHGISGPAWIVQSRSQLGAGMRTNHMIELQTPSEAAIEPRQMLWLLQDRHIPLLSRYVLQDVAGWHDRHEKRVICCWIPRKAELRLESTAIRDPLRCHRKGLSAPVVLPRQPFILHNEGAEESC